MQLAPSPYNSGSTVKFKVINSSPTFLYHGLTLSVTSNMSLLGAG